MSLFSNLGNTQNTSSLFGGAKPAGGNLFNNVNNTPTTTSSLFSNLGSTQTSTSQSQTQQNASSPSSGLGSTQQNQQNTGSLFSGLGLTQQTQQTSSSAPFAGLNASTQPQTQPGGGPFFGLGKQQQNGSASGQQSQQHSSLQVGGGPGAQQPHEGYFDMLLQQARKRAHGETADDEFPQLQLGLGDLRERLKRLASSKPDQPAEGTTHYLLHGSGVDPRAALRDLQNLSNNINRSEKLQPPEASNIDIDGYLANVQTQTTLGMISDGLARSVRDFDTFLEDNVTMEWDAQRKRIYQHFGIKPKESLIAGGDPSFVPSASETQSSFGRSRKSKAAALAGSRAGSRALGQSVRDSGKFSGHKSVIGSAGTLVDSKQPLFTDIEKSIEANGITSPGPNDRFQRERQGRLAEKVQSLNDVRLEAKQPYPILHEFASAAKLSGETHSEKVFSAYGVLIEITEEDTETQSLAEPSAVRERQFAQAYLGEDTTLPDRQNMDARILRGSARYLEKQFLQKVEVILQKAPREANQGGTPDVLSKMKAYVRLKAIRKDFGCELGDLQTDSEGLHVWPLIYYLLRSGCVEEVSSYVSSNRDLFKSVDPSFTTYITQYSKSTDRVLSRDLSVRIQNEYNQRSKVAPNNSVDPYKMAAYKIVGRCEINNRSLNGIRNQDMEDFMWLQFAMAREIQSVSTPASEVCTLATVQNTIKEVGSRFFLKPNDTDYATYFLLLILGGMFEDAVAYLAQYTNTDAVHVAIALSFYGLLRVSDPTQPADVLLSHSTKEFPQIDFGRFVGYYTCDFRAANVVAAADYLCLIGLNQDLPAEAGRKQVALCHEALRELVLESREFALLLGDITTDGERIQGALEKRQNLVGLDGKNEFMRVITVQAASIADDNGRTTDAVLLYHLAGEYDNVLTIITRALSEVVNTPLGQEQYRLQPLKPRAVTESSLPQGSSLSLMSIDDPLELAKTIMKIFAGKEVYMRSIEPSTLGDCRILMDLCEAKIQVDQGHWTEALDIIKRQDLLPLEVAGNASTIRSYASRFSSFSRPVANTVPNVLLWAVTCGSRQRKQLLSARFGGNEGTRQLMIDQLQQQNMDLTMYTSQLRYRFPAQLHETLARAQSE